MREAEQPTTEEPSDAALLEQIARGAEPAFVALYRRRRDDVYRFAIAFGRSASIAQDITQQVFLNVLENAGRFDPRKGSARAWLLGCARHLLLDRLELERRWTPEPPEPTAECDGEERVFAEQRLERLRIAIARLPAGYRDVLALCDLAELSYADSAAVLECPIGTVRSRLHRARALLATLLGPPHAAPQGAAFETSEVCS